MSLQEFLKTVPFFESFTDKQVKIISQYLHHRKYEENEYLFEVNHPGAALFIIERGEVSVETTSDPSSATHLATLQSGEFLGELALLDQSPRSASARATKPTVAYALSRTDLGRLQESEPEIACAVYKSLAFIVGERLKATNRQLGKQGKKAA